MWKAFKKAVGEDGEIIIRLLGIGFLRAVMTDNQKEAYQLFSKQIDGSAAAFNIPQAITVPATIEEKDANIALRLIKLEGDPSQDLVITWIAKGGNKTTMSEKPFQP